MSVILTKNNKENFVQRSISTFLVASLIGVTLPNAPLYADDTRSQHREWVRKLDTPGGTFPYSLDMPQNDTDALVLTPDGTAVQHRTWMRKLETPGGTLGYPLSCAGVFL
jgi:hypothetical protein